MRNATLTILGLYTEDMTLFDNMKLPEGVDKQTLVQNLVMELSCFEMLYPSPLFMKVAIESWSNKEMPVWEKLYSTTQYEYNPTHNYDRTEELEETNVISEEGNDTTSGSGKNSETSNSESSSENTNNTKTSVAAYNSDVLVDQDGSNVTGNATGNVSGSSNSSTESSTEGSYSRKNTKTDTRKVRAYGNIGVTTTQQMIESERKVVEFNIYDRIIDSFKNRFCVLVY